MSIENMELSINLMDTEADIWGIRSSPLPIAHEHKMTEVVAHPISVQSMTKQWNNNLQFSLISIAKVSKNNTYNQLKKKTLIYYFFIKKLLVKGLELWHTAGEYNLPIGFARAANIWSFRFDGVNCRLQVQFKFYTTYFKNIDIWGLRWT